jgi:hypothetical protein
VTEHALLSSPPFYARDEGVVGSICNIGKGNDIEKESAVIDDLCFLGGCEGVASCNDVHQMDVTVSLGGWNACVIQLEMAVDGAEEGVEGW